MTTTTSHNRYFLARNYQNRNLSLAHFLWYFISLKLSYFVKNEQLHIQHKQHDPRSIYISLMQSAWVLVQSLWCKLCNLIHQNHVTKIYCMGSIKRTACKGLAIESHGMVLLPVFLVLIKPLPEEVYVFYRWYIKEDEKYFFF